MCGRWIVESKWMREGGYSDALDSDALDVVRRVGDVKRAEVCL